MKKTTFLKPAEGLDVPDYRKTTSTRQAFFPADGREVELPLSTYERRAIRRGDLTEVKPQKKSADTPKAVKKD